MSTIRRTDSTFTPAEAERITGVTTTLQRDWRRRGFIGSQEGHARFEAGQLAELLAFNVLAERGIGPTRSTGVVSSIGARILFFALLNDEAWDGDRSERGMFLPRVARDAPPDRYFCWGPSDDCWFCQSLDAAFGQRSAVGAVVVVDLKALGERLLSRAGRPLTCIEVEE